MSTRMSSDTSIARDRGDALRKHLASLITGQMATGIAEFPRVWTVPNFVPTTKPYCVLPVVLNWRNPCRKSLIPYTL